VIFSCDDFLGAEQSFTNSVTECARQIGAEALLNGCHKFAMENREVMARLDLDQDGEIFDF
jgi:hypothetical protein